MPWEKQFDIDEALQRAGETFWEKGYDATSMQDLMNAMGIQKGSFYGTYGSKKADRVLRAVPLERLMIETDSPYMTPVPHRSKRNEPAFVVHVAEAFAEKLELPQGEIEEMTTRAASQLFGFPVESD